MMTTYGVKNRKFSLPADGWFQLSPMGEFPGDREYDDGTKETVVQVIDEPALDSMIANFSREKARPNFPGLLVDFDHESQLPGRSTAAGGWIQNLAKRSDGLWAQIDLTTLGQTQLEGGVFRLPSPVWDGPDIAPGRMRPTVLLRGAFTNDPNLRGTMPLSNRRSGPAHNPPDEGKETKDQNTMKRILAVLGLAETASEDAAVDAISGIKNRAGQYDTLKASHDALVDQVAEGDLDAHSVTDADERKAIKPMLISNRAGTLALLKKGAKPTNANPAQKPIHNRAAAGVPAADAVDKTDEPTDAERQRAAKISNRARELQAANPRRGFGECFNQATSENPA